MPRPRHRDGFTTIRTEGAILPRDLLARVAALASAAVASGSGSSTFPRSGTGVSHHGWSGFAKDLATWSIERLNETGEIRADLLTSDAEMQQLIARHSALLWKAKNVREHQARDRSI